jgi:1-acyl-sn-glycerol-3-phosphate acyltransferase
MPTPRLAWLLHGHVVRLLLRLTATPFTVRGLQRLPAGPCVLVSNHGSYLDGVVLMAALPRPFSFVAKRELKDSWVTRLYLRRLGTQFVERFDPGRSVADATAMADLVAQGGSLAVFPEGTFVADDALLPFRLGAFLAAARAGVPVVPVSLRGVRGFLPDGAWFPRRSVIEVEVGEAVWPAPGGSDAFAAAVRMRDAARRAITRHTERE